MHLVPQPINIPPTSVGNNAVINPQIMDAQLSYYFQDMTEYSRIYFKAIHHVTCLGDLYIHEHERKANGGNFLNIRKSTVTLCRLSLDDSLQLQQKGIAYKEPMLLLDRCVIASILYFHSLSLMKNFMSSFNQDIALLTNATPNSTPKSKSVLSRMSVNHQQTYNSFKKDFTFLFNQIVERVESCQSHIQALLQENTALASCLKFHDVSPENILMHMAKVREEDASIEELKNLGWAGKLYTSAINLLEAVLLTTVDVEQSKKLNDYSVKIHEKYEVCRRKAEEVGDVWEN